MTQKLRLQCRAMSTVRPSCSDIIIDIRFHHTHFPEMLVGDCNKSKCPATSQQCFVVVCGLLKTHLEVRFCFISFLGTFIFYPVLFIYLLKAYFFYLLLRCACIWTQSGLLYAIVYTMSNTKYMFYCLT